MTVHLGLPSTAVLRAAGHLAMRVALDLRWGGNFAPPRRDPRAEWYAELLVD